MQFDDFALMIAKGVRNFRFNCARMGYEEIVEKTEALRMASSHCGKEIYIFVDLPGNKARVWHEGGETRVLERHERVRIASSRVCGADSIWIEGEELFKEIEAGDQLLIRTSPPVLLEVIRRSDESLEIAVLEGGHIGNGEHVIIRCKYILNGCLSSADLDVIDLISEIRPTYVCPSFVDTSNIVINARDRIRTEGIRYLAKIESPVGVKNAVSIIGTADGAIVGRDDLSAWFDYIEVQSVTRRIIAECKRQQKIAIPASNYFRSVCCSGELSPEDRGMILDLLRLEPDFIYVNETSIIEAWTRIYDAACSVGLLDTD